MKSVRLLRSVLAIAVFALSASAGATERAAPTVAGDECWSGAFGPRGASNQIFAALHTGTDLYVGGDFTSIGGIAASRIARWDGVSWHPLGSGTNATVRALAWDGTNLYVGGDFALAGGGVVNRIAKWNGTSWSPLSVGVNAAVRALAMQGTDLVLGGDFGTAGGSSFPRLAKWNGTSFSGFGSGPIATVRAIAADATTLYIGGDFVSVDGVAANRVAAYSGGVWTPLAGGVATSSVGALLLVGTDLYVGGTFNTVDGVIRRGLAKWSGSAWNSIGDANPNTVSALAWDGASLYVGGTFTAVGGVSANRIGKRTGSSWSAIGAGFDSSVAAIAIGSGRVFAGGSLTASGSTVTSYLAEWDGASWLPPGPTGLGTSRFPISVSAGPSDLLVGGNFPTAGGTIASMIAKFDGMAWSALGAGLNGAVSAILRVGTDVYVGGGFTQAGGVTANRIAKWNGSSWSTLGSGFDGNVDDLAWDGIYLYAAGVFSNSGATPVAKIARWNGSAWEALGAGLNSTVTSIVATGGEIYAGGAFSQAGGAGAIRIARWNSVDGWRPLQGGLNGNVLSLAPWGTGVAVGGDFTLANGLSTSRIALWNGTAWSALGTGLNGSPNSLLSSGGTLYASGLFAVAGGVAVQNAARWDGASWSALASGLDSPATGMADWNGAIFFVGQIGVAGGNASSGVARWVPGPGISAHPLDRSICAGTGTTFSVTAAGPSLVYTWQIDTGSGFVDVVPDGTFSGVATSTLTVSGASPSLDGALFRCRVGNDCTTIASNAATLDVSLPAGTPAAPTVTATCTALDLSWPPVPGATSVDLLRGSSCATLTVLASALTGTSYPDTTAAPWTPYVYALRPTGACGIGPVGPCTAATLPGTPLPAASLSATDGGSCRVRLDWGASPTPGVVQYVVHHDAGTGTVDYGTAIATLAGSARTFTFDRGVYGDCATNLTLLSDDAVHPNRVKLRLRNANPTSYSIGTLTVGYPEGPPARFVREIRLGGSVVFTAPPGSAPNSHLPLAVTPTPVPAGGAIDVEVAFEESAGGDPDVTGWNTTLLPGGDGFSEVLSMLLLPSGQKPTPCRTGNGASLAVNTDYVFAVRAIDSCGRNDGSSTLTVGAPSCQSALSATLLQPRSGQQVRGARITVVADVVAGVLASAKSVRFEYRPTTGGSWSPLVSEDPGEHPNPSTSKPFFLIWDSSVLPAGDYQMRAVVSDLDDVPDAAPQFITVTLNPTGTSLHGFVNGSSEDELRSPTTISAGGDAWIGDPVAPALDRISLPSGAVSVDTRLRVVRRLPAPQTPLVPAGWGSAGIFRTVELESGESPLAGGRSAELCLAYVDEDADGIADGWSADVRNLRLHSWNVASSSWVRHDSQISTGERLVCGTTSHFSLFALLDEAWAPGDAVPPAEVGLLTMSKAGGLTSTASPVTTDVLGGVESIRYYAVYGSPSPSFVPDTVTYTNLSGRTTTLDFLHDRAATEDDQTWYFRVSAIDEAGNEGAP